MFHIGIDATNLRRGGGRTHLLELLRVARPHECGIDHVTIWGTRETLALLEDRCWLTKRSPQAINKGLLRRTIWQRFTLSREARNSGCNVIFVPGGSYVGSFHPVVVMSRNMLPFEWGELRRFGFALVTIRLILLRWIQARSFRRAEGVIFLTEYARKTVELIIGLCKGSKDIIHHGLNPRFRIPPRQQLDISTYSIDRPFRLIYVSIINQYKHQWRVVEAIGRLRARTGLPLALDLIGPAYQPALRLLDKSRVQWDPHNKWVNYHGEISYERLHEIYRRADLGIFASTCENMPNILLETMAAGLPIACSDRGPMPEVLGEAGVYFDPLDTESIARAVERLIWSPQMRKSSAEACYARAMEFSWESCANQSFRFLADVAFQASSKVSVATPQPDET